MHNKMHIKQSLFPSKFSSNSVPVSYSWWWFFTNQRRWKVATA